MTRNFEFPGRSVVRSADAMVATSHPLASSAALDALRRGGTAMDAAISAAAVLAVVEPAETGIGGDCFALYCPQGRVPPVALNGSGRAPLAAHPEWFAERGIAAIDNTSAHAVTVPGAVDAWCALHARFGRLDMEALLQPAVRYAENGYVVHERVADEWQLEHARLMSAEARAVFLPDGRVPRAGQVMRNPALGALLRRIGREGRGAFYEGENAERIVSYLASLGGLHSLEDFAGNRPDFTAPIVARHAGQDIYQLPPNTQGVVALLLLRILTCCGADRLAYDDPKRIHMVIEAAKIAYAWRDDALGEAGRSEAILALLADTPAIERLAAKIRADAVNPDLPAVRPASSNTVYLSVVDRDRNVASFINSIYHSFGTGLVAPGTGVLLQSRGSSFRLDPRHPNALAPGRRPMHTIIPGMAGMGDRATMSFGVMGGDYQPLGHAQLLTAILDHGLDLQEACDAPRFMPKDGVVQVEAGIDAATRQALRAMGHDLVDTPSPLGGAQVVAIDWREGTLSAGSDSRKDGCAIGF